MVYISRSLDATKLFFKNDGNINIFSDKLKQRIIASWLALQETLKEVLKGEGKRN